MERTMERTSRADILELRPTDSRSHEPADEFAELLSLGFPVESVVREEAPARRGWLTRLRTLRRAREVLTDERGAVTAEYALVIMAAVAFAGLLIVILRSDEVRQMLLTLVQNALGSAG